MPSSLRPLSTADVLGALPKVAPTQLNQQYVDALSSYAGRASNNNGINTEGTRDHSRGSRRPYQHPSGYYVHKTNDGSSYLATFSTDGQHQNSVYDTSTDDESEIDSEGDTSSSEDENEEQGFSGFDDDDEL